MATIVIPHPVLGLRSVEEDAAKRFLFCGFEVALPDIQNGRWHMFRHTCRSWLDDAGAPIGVQQKLMRHADITTTAKCGDALVESKHNSVVPSRALGKA